MEEQVKKDGRIKTHFKKHGMKYLIGVGAATIGGIAFYAGYRYKECNSIDNSKDMVIKNIVAKDVKVEQNDNSINNYINIIQNAERRGHAGNMVYCPELERAFNSQSEAEKSLNLSKGSVSKVLNGKIGSAKGLTFTKFADFNSDEPRIIEENVA